MLDGIVNYECYYANMTTVSPHYALVSGVASNSLFATPVNFHIYSIVKLSAILSCILSFSYVPRLNMKLFAFD